MKHLFLVDGSGYIFRAYHALPPLSRSDGTPIGAVAGYTTMMLKLVEDTEADYIAVVFDAARRSFRNDIYPDYKAHRPPPPDDLIPQFSLIREATSALGVIHVEADGFEADDLIATYTARARAQGMRVTIVSSDKDLMQLVDDGVSLFDAMKNKPIGTESVLEKFGVPPNKVIDVQALAGDTSDNVPGVPGIGVKTAATLITEYGDLETLLDRAAEIRQPKRRESLQTHANDARLSKQLVRLRSDAPMPIPLENFARPQPDFSTLLPFLEKMEFRRLTTLVKSRIAANGHTPSGDIAPLRRDDSVGASPSQTDKTSHRHYQLVQDAPALQAWIERAYAAGTVAIDTETNSLNALQAQLVGISLSVTPGEACYIPLRHRPQNQGDLLATSQEPVPKQLPICTVVDMLRPLLVDPGVLKVGHNIKYDLHILAGEGLQVSPLDDTMVLSYVLDAGSHGHGMDELAALHLGHTTIRYEDVCGKGKTAITFDEVPLDVACDYAAEDADITLQLHTLLRARLLSERMVTVYERLDRPLIPILFAMEQRGIRVDHPTLANLSIQFAKRMSHLQDEIYRLADETFNIASPKQLGDILFGKLHLTGGKKSSKTGAWSTSADVLEQLAAEGNTLPQKVLDWRALAKLRSTYTEALVRQINPRTQRVHTSFSMTITTTGRLSSNEPNLQNIPIRSEDGRAIRTAFVARPGHKLLSADYSQIELRLIAHVADVPALKEAFHNNLDIHAITASRVFGVPQDAIDPALRRRAKAINFGIIYGISAFGLGRQLGISNSDAKNFIDSYFAMFPEIRTYMDATIAHARQHGFVYTPFGRKCFTPDIQSKNPASRSFSERAAINAPLQGGAADIIKKAMAALPLALTHHGLQGHLLLQVHDELVLEVPDSEIEATRSIVRHVMENAARLSVPLIVDSGVSENWANAH